MAFNISQHLLADLAWPWEPAFFRSPHCRRRKFRLEHRLLFSACLFVAAKQC